MNTRPAILATVLALAVSCGTTTAKPAPQQPPTGQPTVTLPDGDPNAPMPAAGTCRLGTIAGQAVPDPACTPGAVNPAVTEATTADTICKSGWTKTVRPPVNITNRWKAQSAKSYGITAAGEYDHLISLQLGGAPLDPRNLWVEPGAIPNPKDTVENRLNDAVCAGLVPLTVAQQAIARSWPTALVDLGVTATGKVCTADGQYSTGRHAGEND